MTTRTRSALLTAAFAITVATAIAGLTFRGETKEASKDETCSHAAWPSIPAACLSGGPGHEVRFVTADKIGGTDSMQIRFNTAFN